MLSCPMIFCSCYALSGPDAEKRKTAVRYIDEHTGLWSGITVEDMRASFAFDFACTT